MNSLVHEFKLQIRFRLVCHSIDGNHSRRNNLCDMSLNKVAELSRKIRKPLMEKKRRARINDSLETLKNILLENTAAVTQGHRPAKLEKADILEMTVTYVEILQQRLNCAEDLVTSTTPDHPVSLQTSAGNVVKKQKCWKLKPVRHRESVDEVDKENVRPPREVPFPDYNRNVDIKGCLERRLPDHSRNEGRDRHWRPW